MKLMKILLTMNAMKMRLMKIKLVKILLTMTLMKMRSMIKIELTTMKMTVTVDLVMMMMMMCHGKRSLVWKANHKKCRHDQKTDQ